MAKITAENAGKQEFIVLLRELVRAYQAFSNFDAAGLRQAKLSQSQADVIFTLGNTQGLTFKAIGDSTLITKGTLTGVIDRLEKKGLVTRILVPDDRRCTLVKLTAQGNKVFEKEFPRQISYLKERFDRLSKTERQQAVVMLKKIRALF